MPEYSYCELEIPQREILTWDSQVEPEARAQALLESEVLSREYGDGLIAARQVLVGMRKAFVDHGIDPMPSVFQVPSVVVPQEWNYLIDPTAVNRIQWSDPKPFRIDPRLLDPGLR